MMRKIVIAVAVLLALAAIPLVLLSESYRGFNNETFVTIPHGTSTREIANTLAQSGVIRSPWQLLAERALHPNAKLQAGEYRFREAATPSQVFDRIARGDIFYFELTVPEGSNMFDIGRIVESAGAMSSEDFLKAAADPAPIRDLDPAAKTLEGYLFPSTYRVTHSTTPAEFARQMTTQFRKHWTKLAPSTDPHRAVTLASLVEKETGVAAERPLVAGVFENRLRINMPLQCDPTTIYAALLENRFRDTIHKSDLANKNPYNTYQHTGLPPGPIANPGADAIAAALHPSETNYLYFVAKPGGGGHNFSTDLATHEKATRAYRKARKTD
jgi:UPF0755 protein